MFFKYYDLLQNATKNIIFLTETAVRKMGKWKLEKGRKSEVIWEKGDWSNIQEVECVISNNWDDVLWGLTLLIITGYD